MRRFILSLAMTAIVIPAVFAQDEYDDIYYNPKTTKDGKESKSKKSNYIADFSSMDVDDYNKRGFYYETEIDTIGSRAENAEDFVYTQQIQKYYNPTIVVDNADVLEDLLENSYGNVDIVIDNGTPVFTSIYTGGYGWAPSYYNWCVRPSWTWSYAYGPFAWSWNWGPSWTWGPSWSWGWDYYPGYYPGWGYRPWYPAPRPRPNYAYNHRPGATRPVGPNPGWSHNTRPGGNYNGSAVRPGSTRPGGTRGNGNRYTASSRYDRNNQAVVRKDVNAGGNTPSVRPSRNAMTNKNAYGSARIEGMKSTTTNSVNTNNRSYNSNSERYKNMNTTTNSNRSYNTTRNTTNRNYNTTTTTRNYNTTTRNTNSNRSYNYNSGSSRSYNSGASRGSFGGSRSSGGGSHGGGRGGRR